MILLPYSPPKHGEMAWYLKEYTGNHMGVDVRYQALAVVRDDRLVEFPRIMGPVTDYPGAQDMFIFGGFEESCDALMNYADGLREDTGLDLHMQEHAETSTLMQDYVTHIEQRKDIVNKRGRTVRALKSLKPSN